MSNRDDLIVEVLNKTTNALEGMSETLELLLASLPLRGIKKEGAFVTPKQAPEQIREAVGDVMDWLQQPESDAPFPSELFQVFQDAALAHADFLEYHLEGGR